jgi:hypothetical protein
MHLSVTVGVEQREVGGMIAATVNAMTAMMEVPTGFRRDVLGADRADPSLCSLAPDEEFPASPPQPGDPESTVILFFPGRVIGVRRPPALDMPCERHFSHALEVDRSHALMPSLDLTVEAPLLWTHSMVVAFLTHRTPCWGCLRLAHRHRQSKMALSMR